MPENRPSFPWYAKEWLTSTRGLSPAARGFYIDMLSLAWVNGGCEADTEALRRSVGAEKAEWRRAWPELEPRWPVVDGRRINARLERTRQEATAYTEAKRIAGKMGGKAKAERLASGKQTPSKDLAEDVANTLANPSLASASASAKKKNPLTPKGEYPPDFERFWTSYPNGSDPQNPRRGTKATAFKAWQKLDPDESFIETMLAALAWQRRTRDWTKESGQFIPNVSTWLNQRRWEAEHPDGALNGTILDDDRLPDVDWRNV